MKNILLLTVIAFSWFNTTGQEKTDHSEPIRVINNWLDAQKDYENIPGISAAIVVDQDLIWSNGFGYSDLNLKNKTTDTTIYSICSISKLFTSIAIMQLRDKGLLDLDDSIEEHLSWFNIGQSYPKSAPISIRSLLTHSSGLPREGDIPYWTAPDYPFPTLEELKKITSKQETLYSASTTFQYSNLAMSLLGAIVSEKTGIPYEEYVKKNILEPMGLKNTRPELPEKSRHGQLATGYSIDDRNGKRQEENFFQANGIAPAAGFSSTAKDLAKFAEWQIDATTNIDDPILNGNTLKEMQRVQWMNPDWDLTWGLGFSVNKYNEQTVVGHGGSCPGYLTQVKLFPKKKWAFVFMVNAQGIDVNTYNESMYNILNSYEQAEKEEVKNVNLENYSGVYYTNWSGEEIIVPWKGKLAVFSLKSPKISEPYNLLKHIEGDTFQVINNDGEPREKVKFERDNDGNIIKYWQHSNPTKKIGLLK